MQTGDDLLDYRARAAACRAKAEKAGEHHGEAKTWLQVAAMWDGLAERLENGADSIPLDNGGGEPVPLGSVAPAPHAASAAEVASRGEHRPREEFPPLEPPRQPASPVARRAAGPGSPRPRRVVVAVGLLLLLLAPVSVLWWLADRPMGMAEGSGSVQTKAEPQIPAAAPVVEERVAKTAQAVQPAAREPPAETDAAGPPSPEPAAVVPPPAAPPPAQSAEQLSAEAGLPIPAPADPAPAALPPAEPPPATATQLGAVAGTWWPDACPKPAERKNAVPMILSEDRARAGAASCAFQRKTPTANGWTIVARCSDGSQSWTAHIRLVHAGKRLQWASERGSLTYFRCS